jgi:hypothetical protein
MHLAPDLMQGPEETEPLDVVHVQMGQEDVHTLELGFYGHT